MTQQADARVAAIHRSPHSGVITVTGGGSGLLSSLLGVGGASATVLEAYVPYSSRSLCEWLGAEPAQACSDETARAMAVRAFLRAVELGGDFGFAVTAALATTRPKRGAHRAHLAFHDASSTRAWSLALDKSGAREWEERMVATTAIEALAHALRVGDAPALPGAFAKRGARFADVMLGVRTHVGDSRFGAILPGAFNPLHDGHRRMRADAEHRLGQTVGYELSMANVDKPMLDYLELDARLAQFDETDVVVTNAPTFVDKARALGGVIFVVGADTVQRIAASSYYGGETQRDAAIAEMSGLGCRFLVYGRIDGSAFKSLEDLTLPPGLAAMCTGVPESEFRNDLSSTALRQQR